MNLTAPELRVLGALLEKQRTTPDAYPLSLNALRLACNQSTARDPVVDYDEVTVRDALTRLGRRRWTRLTSGAGRLVGRLGRLPGQKEERFEQRLGTGAGEQAAVVPDAGRSSGESGSSGPHQGSVLKPAAEARLGRLEIEVARLRAELALLKDRLDQGTQ